MECKNYYSVDSLFEYIEAPKSRKRKREEIIDPIIETKRQNNKTVFPVKQNYQELINGLPKDNPSRVDITYDTYNVGN